MPLSKHLREAVVRVGLDASKYPDVPSIRAAVRRAERLKGLHASPEEIPPLLESVGNHPTSRSIKVPHTLEAGVHKTGSES